MRNLVVLLALFFVSALADRHLNGNGPFGKRHVVGDEPSPFACDRRTGVSSALVAVTNINVSTTTFSSNEQMNISWTPVASPCADDFVGVYFAEIDPSHGK